MQKYIIILLFVQLISIAGSAQQPEKITVKAGEDLSAVLSSYGMYRFPAFTDGIVTFRNGNTSGGKLNYNIYLGLIQFIDTNGDTLAISNPETIDSVSIDTSLFYYHNGYYQVIANYENCKLVMKQKIEFRPVKLGAYGLPVNNASGQSYESLSAYHVINSKLTVNEDIIVIKENVYYLFYKKFRNEKANLQGYLNAFPNYKNEIQSFVTAHKTNFQNLEDLKQLTLFCTRLK